MKTVWNAGDARALRSRMDHLTPDSRARWGKFDAPSMVTHLADALRMASGELAVRPKHLPIRYTPLRQLLIYVLPMPKSAPTAPELLSRKCVDWTCELDDLGGEFDRFVTRGRSGPFVPHPAFGPLTPTAWGVLVYKHTDHHLRQFGV